MGGEPPPPGEIPGELMKYFCHVHQAVELPGPSDFRACCECGHLWRTVEEFHDDVRRELDPVGQPFDPDLPFCPLCTHDW